MTPEPDYIRLIKKVVKQSYREPYGVHGSMEKVKSLYDCARLLEDEICEEDAVRIYLMEDKEKTIAYLDSFLPELRCLLHSFEYMNVECRPIYCSADESEKRIISTYYAQTKRALSVVVQMIDFEIKSFDTDFIQDCNNNESMPDVLKNPDAQRIFGWLIEDGLITESYGWKDGRIKTKRRLAYLCYKMSSALGLGKNLREIGCKNKNDVQWKPFEELFKVKNLRFNLKDLRSKDGNINGVYPDIDKFF